MMPIPGAGPGAYNPGFAPSDELYHNSKIGQPFVWSGALGRPAYASELPAYEQAAYGFPQGGGAPGGGMSPQYQKDLDAYNAGYSHQPPNPKDPKYSMGGGQLMGGFSQTSSYQSQTAGGPNTDYQRAATNAIQAMYNRLRSRSQEELFTLGAKTGTFASGVNKERVAGRMGELDLNEAADVARIWQQNGGSSSSSGAVNSSSMGPWSMGGGGMALPGFLPQPGSAAVKTDHDGSRPGGLVGANGATNYGWGGVR